MLQVIWHKQAEDAWYRMGAYCREFGQKSLDKFIRNVQEWVLRIARNPAIGPKEPLLADRPEEYRSVVTHKNCKLVYYVKGDILHIAALWDTRREPHTQADNMNNI